MGSLFQGSTQTTQAPFESNPWGPQAPFLQSGFEAALKALNQGTSQANRNPGLPGMNDGQRQALNDIGYNGTSLGRAIQPTVQGALGTVAQGNTGPTSDPAYSAFLKSAQGLANGQGSFAGDIYSRSQQPGQGAALASNVYDSFGQDPRYSKAGSIFGDVSGDKTGSLVANAGKYVNNDILNGQIDAASRDVVRNLEQARGGISASAVGANASNSSRTGTLEAYAQRDAADRIGDISAQMRGDAYSTGISAALNAEGMRQGNTLGAGSLLQQDDAYRMQGMQGQLGAAGALMDNANTRLNIGLGAEQARQNGQVAGAGLLGDAASQFEGRVNNAGNRYSQSIGDLSSIYGIGRDANLDRYDSGTAQNDRAVAQYQDRLMQMGLPLSLVQQYMGAVGGNFGSQGFQTSVSQSASPFQQLLGGAATGLGAWGAFR